MGEETYQIRSSPPEFYAWGTTTGTQFLVTGSTMDEAVGLVFDSDGKVRETLNLPYKRKASFSDFGSLDAYARLLGDVIADLQREWPATTDVIRVRPFDESGMILRNLRPEEVLSPADLTDEAESYPKPACVLGLDQEYVLDDAGDICSS